MKPNVPRPLLDRFLGGPEPQGFDGYAEIILRDVEDLLNTRLVSVFGDDDEEAMAYGLPDLTVTGRTEGELSRLAWRVRNCLEKYEPRLKRVQVEALPSPPDDFDLLTVRITAAVAGFEKGRVLSFDFPLPFSQGQSWEWS